MVPGEACKQTMGAPRLPSPTRAVSFPATHTHTAGHPHADGFGILPSLHPKDDTRLGVPFDVSAQVAVRGGQWLLQILRDLVSPPQGIQNAVSPIYSESLSPIPSATA